MFNWCQTINIYNIQNHYHEDRPSTAPKMTLCKDTFTHGKLKTRAIKCETIATRARTPKKGLTLSRKIESVQPTRSAKTTKNICSVGTQSPALILPARKSLPEESNSALGHGDSKQELERQLASLEQTYKLNSTLLTKIYSQEGRETSSTSVPYQPEVLIHQPIPSAPNFETGSESTS